MFGLPAEAFLYDLSGAERTRIAASFPIAPALISISERLACAGPANPYPDAAFAAVRRTPRGTWRKCLAAGDAAFAGLGRRAERHEPVVFARPREERAAEQQDQPPWVPGFHKL